MGELAGLLVSTNFSSACFFYVIAEAVAILIFRDSILAEGISGVARPVGKPLWDSNRVLW